MRFLIDIAKTKMTAWRLFFDGNLSFGQAFRFMFSHFLPPNKETVATLFGKPFTVPRGEMYGFVGCARQIIFSNQYHIELVRDDGNVIDAGANIGVFSIFAAVRHPQCKIFAFEPAASIYKILKENTKYYSNIEVFNCALGEKNEMVSFVTIPNRSGENHVGSGGEPVAMKTIDGLGMRVDFLKMDTEGHEANVLKGATETIKKYKPVIVMSAYHKPNDKTEVPTLLNSIASYNCELRSDCEEDLICKPL